MTLYGDLTVPTTKLKSYAGKRPGFQRATVAFTRHDCKARHLGDGGRGYNEEEARRPWRPVDGGEGGILFRPLHRRACSKSWVLQQLRFVIFHAIV